MKNMLLTTSPVGVVVNERVISVPGWAVIVSLKPLGASTFLVMLGKRMKRRDDLGKKQSCLRGNDFEKPTQIRHGKYIERKSKVSLRWV